MPESRPCWMVQKESNPIDRSFIQWPTSMDPSIEVARIGTSCRLI